MTTAARHAPPALAVRAASDAARYLPSPPTVTEKYSYFGRQRRWPFVWLFISQICLLGSYVMVMRHSPETAFGLILLTVMVPPVFVNVWLRVRHRRITLADHLARVQAWPVGRPTLPSVDVFLPTCGEEPAVLDNTFRHVAALEWAGRLRMYALDDADDSATAMLAQRYGFTYVVRPNRGELKKAGNLIHAFDRSDGDFIVVFDADFAPRPDFLGETLPYFDEASLGVLQTAQYFDVDTRVNYVGRYAGALQEMFFRWIQPARDVHEAAICAGTNVVYRRHAVEAAGGFARVPLGEDVHSGVKIWNANYATRYVPLAVAKGIAPDNWDALTNQQYRWCRSSMLLMVSQFFRNAPFSRRQRLCFWAAFLYYMSSAAMPIVSVLPTLTMVWLYPEQVHARNYLPMLPSILATLIVFPLIVRNWRPTIYRVCTINSFCHVLAVFDAVRNKVQAWVPTGAVTQAQPANVPRRVAVLLRLWIVAAQTLLWVGLVRDLRDYSILAMWPAILLGNLQLFMLGPFLFRLNPQQAVQADRTASTLDSLAAEPVV